MVCSDWLGFSSFQNMLPCRRIGRGSRKEEATLTYTARTTVFPQPTYRLRPSHLHFQKSRKPASLGGRASRQQRQNKALWIVLSQHTMSISKHNDFALLELENDKKVEFNADVLRRHWTSNQKKLSPHKHPFIQTSIETTHFGRFVRRNSFLIANNTLSCGELCNGCLFPFLFPLLEVIQGQFH